MLQMKEVLLCVDFVGETDPGDIRLMFEKEIFPNNSKTNIYIHIYRALLALLMFFLYCYFSSNSY